jgi:prevent-host-death family protein
VLANPVCVGIQCRAVLTMVDDHGRLTRAMERVPVSKFKATCLALLERVRRTGQPILVTRRGVPIAQVIPPPPRERPESWLGSLKGTGRITGDILSPALEENVWEALDSDRSR